MKIDKQSPLPRHYQLGESIKRDIIIKQGLCKGDPVPSERRLSDMYNVSRMTVRRAISQLVDNGVLQRIERRGTFVDDTTNISIQGFNGARRLLGVMIPDIEDFFAARLVRGMHDQCSKSGFSIVLAHSDEDYQKAADQIEHLAREEIAGFIIVPVACEEYEEANMTLFEKIRSHGIPFVLLDRYVSDANVDVVVSDNFDATYICTNHLIDLGHRRIAYIGYPTCSSVTDRIAGYKKCLMDFSIYPDNNLIIYPHKRRDLGATRAAVYQLMAIAPKITAIITANDWVALDVFTVIRELGLRIPDDIALIGYDNAGEVLGSGAMFTTVEQPLYDEGQLACKMLLERIAGLDAEPRFVTLKSRFLQGASTIGNMMLAQERNASEVSETPYKGHLFIHMEGRVR